MTMAGKGPDLLAGSVDMTHGGGGRAMAELIRACEAGHDHDADPLKLTMLHTGLTLDMGFYSRKREINKESSFSVLG